MINFNRFKDGKKFIATFSYDDGFDTDIRLIELFNKYGVKGTFHLNSKRFVNYSQEQLFELKKRYEGHEISAHTFNHYFPTRMSKTVLVNEVMEDRKFLEKIAGYPVCGMSYPFGDYNDEVIKTIRECGILYSRTVENTRRFKMPENFLEWHPTIHHNGIQNAVNDFFEKMSMMFNSEPLLYIWGHSFEFKTDEQWQMMEDAIAHLCERKDEIWFATNIEIYNYMTAIKNLRVAADESSVYNPTDTDLWFEKDAKVCKIPAGATVNFNEIEDRKEGLWFE